MTMHWLHEGAFPMAVLDPQTVANTAKFTTSLDMSKFAQATFVFLLGDMANEAIDCGVYECATSGGTFTAVSGKQATQLAASAGGNDNKQIVITVRAEEMTAGQRYLRGRMVTGNTTGGPACAVGIAQPRYGPATDDKPSTVVQVVT